MAKDVLTVSLSSQLAQNLGIVSDPEQVDYFQLLGVRREYASGEQIERMLLERSKVLRQWQSSPQYGSEVVKLLPLLHRAAKILKDPARCNMYRQELERQERGETEDALDQFTELVRAGLADGQLDIAVRRELTQFANTNKIPQAEAQRVFGQVREELQAKRKAEAEAAKAEAGGEEDWEFRIAGEGEDAFGMMMHGMEVSGKFTEDTPKRLIQQAQKYKISPQRAAQLIADFQKVRFRNMVKLVAGQRAVTEDQIRILMAKAGSFGLDQQQAYAIISDYSLTMNIPDEMYEVMASAEVFSQEEIGELVEEEEAGPRVRRGGLDIPDWLRNLLLLVIVGGAIIGAVVWLTGQFGSRGREGLITRKEEAAPAPPGDGAPRTAPAPGAAETPGPSAPGGSEPDSAMLVSKPDPPSGYLLFAPDKPSDPPAFEMAIQEVTCGQFQQFLKATLEPAPLGWGADGSFPPGHENMPVTGVPQPQALTYCTWLAGRSQMPAGSYRLPSLAEYYRVARGGMTTRGNPRAVGFWGRAKLGSRPAPVEVRATIWDKLFILPDRGQIYDLIGNVAEWTRDAKQGKVAVFGGDYSQKDANYDFMQPRWLPPETRQAAIGLRLVRTPAP